MKVPFFVREIVREDDLLSNSAHFQIYLINGKKISVNIHLLYLEEWGEEFLEQELWNQVFSALKQDAKEIAIQDSNEKWTDTASVTTYWNGHPIDGSTLDNLSQAAFGTPGQQDIGKTVGSTMKKLVPALSTVLKCPGKDCSHKEMTLSSIIVILNDRHKWTREQIADWLDSLDLDLEFKEQNAEQS